MTRPKKNGRTTDAVVARLARLESVQRDGNRRLGHIEGTLETSSRLFELMDDRLEAIEKAQRSLVDGQRSLVEGQRSLVEGQKLVIGRLDRLVAATLRERTRSSDRLSRVERRLEALEDRLSSPK